MYTFSEPIGYIFCITLVIDAEHLQIGTAVELGDRVEYDFKPILKN